MADHVPADLRGERAGFSMLHAALVVFVDLPGALRENLHARLTEVGYAEPQDFPDLLGGGGFCHGDERHFARIALGLLTGFGDAILHLVQFFSKRRSFGHAVSFTNSLAL